MKFLVMLIFILVFIVFFGVMFVLLFDTWDKSNKKFKSYDDALNTIVGNDWRTYIQDKLYSHLTGEDYLDVDTVSYYYLLMDDDFIYKERSSHEIKRMLLDFRKIKNRKSCDGELIKIAQKRD